MRRCLSFALRLALVATLVAPALVMADAEAAYAQAPDKEFTISVGETLTFNARGVRTVTIGLPSVADAKVTSDNRELIVTGKSPGVTTMNIFASEGQKTLLVRVVGVNPNSLAEEVREVLGPRSGVDVRVVKGRVLLEGEVTSDIFKTKVKKLTELYPNQVLNFTTFREAFVEGARMVALDVYFIQLATTERDQLGVKWGQFLGANYTFGSGDVPLYYSADDAGITSGAVPGQDFTEQPILSRPVTLTGGDGLTSYWSLVGQLNVALDFMVENGLLKTIQQGTIITEAGQEAFYHSGGTLLIPLESLSGASLIEKPFGMKVKILPILDFENRVKLEIELEYAEIDNSTVVQGVPSLRNNTIKSTVNMREGQSVLVSTQNNLDASSDHTGWFLLSRIPILGWLFKSRTYLGRTLDNAFFITPRIYEPGGATHRTLIKGVFENLLDNGAEPEELPELSEKTGGARPEPQSASENEEEAEPAEPSLVDEE